jgi:hypothetical protein
MGARSTPRLSLENLESRLNLSTLTTMLAHAPAAAAGSSVQDMSTLESRRYRTDALTDAGANFGKTFTNPGHTEAQRFFNAFKNRYTPYQPPAPAPTPDPVPAPDPVPPPPPPAPGSPVSITQQNLGVLNRLTITGTSGNDTIIVSQSGGTLTINANGNVSTVSGSFGELAIYGGAGNDTITVQSSVNLGALIYGGTGNNVLTAGATAKSYIVSIGGSADVLVGNGFNTSFWADPSDSVNASATEVLGGDVHIISSFMQPFSTNPANADYVSTALNGQNLRDPTDSGTTTRLTNRSLWGNGPLPTDVNQGQIGDCYYLASIQSFAAKIPQRLREMAVDLGDGTYAVQFKRGGVATYVRVDADLSAASWGGLAFTSPTATGGIWASLFEKAYAYYRTGANTYASLNWGWTGAAYSDLGVANTTFTTTMDSNSLFSTITNALNSSKAVSIITNGTVNAGVPVVSSHAYSIMSTSIENGIQMITLRNPWGIDGVGNDGNPNDALVKVSIAQLQANFSAGSISL